MFFSICSWLYITQPSSWVEQPSSSALCREPIEDQLIGFVLNSPGVSILHLVRLLFKLYGRTYSVQFSETGIRSFCFYSHSNNWYSIYYKQVGVTADRWRGRRPSPNHLNHWAIIFIIDFSFVLSGNMIHHDTSNERTNEHPFYPTA